MLQPLSVRANFAWTFGGNLVYAFCQWAMLMVLAKLGTPEIVGQFSLALALTAPVIMFSNLQLGALQATDADRRFVFGHYFGLRLLCSCAALLLILGLSGGYRSQTAWVVVAIGMAKVVESLSDILYGTLQQRGRMDRVAQSMLLKGPLSLLALGAGLFFGGELFWSALGLLAVWVVMLPLDLHNAARVLGLSKSRLVPQWEFDRLLQLAWLALPLGFVMLLVSLNYNIPRVIVERHLGERELGIFAALAYFMVAGNTVIHALGQSASPVLAKAYAGADRRGFCRLLLRQAGLAGLLGVGGVLTAAVGGEPLLSMLYRPEYGVHASLLVWLMAAAGVEYVAVILDYGLTASRLLKPQLGLSVLVTGSLSAGTLLLLPAIGLSGVALALLLAALLHLIGGAALTLYALARMPGRGSSRCA